MRGRLVAWKSNLVDTIEGAIDCPRPFCSHYWFKNPYLNVNEVSNQLPQVSFKRFVKKRLLPGRTKFLWLSTNWNRCWHRSLKQASISLLVESKVLLIKITDCFTFLFKRRFKLSLDPANVVPVDDLIPELILRSKNGIRINISTRI